MTQPVQGLGWVKMRYRSFIVRIMAKGRVPPKNCKSVVFNHLGGIAETIPLIVKYIHKGNIHYLVEKHVKKICNKKTTLKYGGVSEVWSRTTPLHFLVPFPNGDTIIVWEKFNLTSHRRV